MSQANVEIAKRAVDAFNRRDFDLAAELTTDDFAMFSPMFDVEGKSYRGCEGLEAYFEEVRDAWEEYCLVTDEFRDLGDSVLVLGRIEGRGRGSGVQVDAPLGAIYEFRGDKIWRGRPFLSHGEALRAAGLSK